MYNFDLSQVTLEQMNIFVHAAANLSFTKTADELNLSQATVSKKIAALESTLHVLLFVRWRRSLRLTYSGETLARLFKKLLDDFANGVTSSQQHQFDKQANLTIVFSKSVYPYHIGKALGQRYPERTVRYINLEYYAMLQSLQDMECDFAFYGSAGTEAFSIPPLKCHTIARYPFQVFMCADHPLAQKKELVYADLRDQNFMMFQPTTTPWSDYFTDCCKQAGFHPKITGYYPTFAGACANLAREKAIFITDTNTIESYMSHEMGLVSVPLAASEPPNTSNLIWNENGPNAWMAEEMIQVSKEVWSKVPYATVCD